jgi:hypothetical protein
MVIRQAARRLTSLLLVGGPVLLTGLPVGADMLGGPPPCIAGTSPALFDTDGTPGPSSGDEPAYLEIVTTDPLEVLARHPAEGCNDPGSNMVWFEDWYGNPWPGTYNRLGYEDWRLESNVQAPGTGYVIGATLTQYSYTILNYDALLEENGNGAYDRLGVTGDLTAEGDLLGWDGDGDGTDDYIGLSWAGLTSGWNPCDIGGGVVISDSTMLWVPVVPFGDGSGAVKVAVDMDCDGVADSGFPPPPPLVAMTVPVELQSFTVASLLPGTTGRFGLAALAAVALSVLPGLFRRRLTGPGEPHEPAD